MKKVDNLSKHEYDLMSEDLMSAMEASKIWGYEESYVWNCIK